MSIPQGQDPAVDGVPLLRAGQPGDRRAVHGDHGARACVTHRAGVQGRGEVLFHSLLARVGWRQAGRASREAQAQQEIPRVQKPRV